MLFRGVTEVIDEGLEPPFEVEDSPEQPRVVGCAVAVLLIEGHGLFGIEDASLPECPALEHVEGVVAKLGFQPPGKGRGESFFVRAMDDFIGENVFHGLAEDELGPAVSDFAGRGQGHGEFDEPVVEERHAGFDGEGHARAVAILEEHGEVVAGQVAVENFSQRVGEFSDRFGERQRLSAKIGTQQPQERIIGERRFE